MRRYKTIKQTHIKIFYKTYSGNELISPKIYFFLQSINLGLEVHVKCISNCLGKTKYITCNTVISCRHTDRKSPSVYLATAEKNLSRNIEWGSWDTIYKNCSQTKNEKPKIKAPYLYRKLIVMCVFILRSFYSRLIAWGASASPFTLSLSAVFKKAGSCSWLTFTSPAYINSKIACKWLYATSFSIMMGCFDGFS
jgi:hypothetical protein